MLTVTSRDLVIRTLNHDPIDRVPRDLWSVPGIAMDRADELAEMEVRFPSDIARPDFRYPPGQRAQGRPNHVGQYTDAWGCTWQVIERGHSGEVKNPPLADASKIREYRPPLELLEEACFDKANRSCATTSRFVLAWTETRPFERLQFLRGTEATYVDLANGEKHLRDLLAMLHDFYCREMELWAATDVDGVAFMDDWGSQTTLLISPEMWRELFKPLYRDYCEILHAADKFAFFHCDGFIADIFGDLVDVGIDAINCQLALMNLPRLAAEFRGCVTFWGDIDRQQILPRGTPEDVAREVRRVRKELDFGSGGLIAQCEWGLDVPRQNIAAAFESWQAPLPMHIV